MSNDFDCQDFLDFEAQFGEKVASDLLQEACEAFYGSRDLGRRRGERVNRHGRTSHDAQGNNHTFTGTIDHGARCWSFEIDDGNNAGTVVRSWEREWKHGGFPLPAQTAWMFQPVKVIAVHLYIEGLTAITVRKMQTMMVLGAPL